MKFAANILFFVLFTLPYHANATLITQDLIMTGDRLATYDDRTGNLWIKSSVTKGKSYAEVETLIATTYLFSGFRIASLEDVRDLGSWYQLFDPYYDIDVVASFYDALVAPFDLDKSTNFSINSGYGYSGTRENDTDAVRDRDGWARAWGGSFGCSNGFCNAHFHEYGSNDGASPRDRNVAGSGGFFLVKNVVNVPEPSPIALLAMGLLVIWAKKRTRKNT